MSGVWRDCSVVFLCCIIAPATPPPPATGQPAGVRVEAPRRCEGGEALASGNRDRNRTTRGQAVAQLADGVVAPAVGRPGASEPACIIPAGSEGAKAQVPGDGDGLGAPCRRAVAQLPADLE